MILWKRAAVFGFVSWLIPFALSFLLFPLKTANAPLYSSLLNLIGLATTAWMLYAYFRGRIISWREATLIGVLWAAANLLLDSPFFSFGPMRMTASQYWSEIGLGYFAIPVFAFGAARIGR
jgi:hypothetical protein